MKFELRNSFPDTGEVTSLLERLLADPSMPGASLVFIATWSNLSQEYVSPLCKIIMTDKLSAWHEQAIDILGEVPSPEAVQALAAR